MSQPDASVIEYVNNHRLAVLATQRKAKSAQLTVINYMFNGEDFKVSVRGFSQKAKNILKRQKSRWRLSMAATRSSCTARQTWLVNSTKLSACTAK